MVFLVCVAIWGPHVLRRVSCVMRTGRIKRADRMKRVGRMKRGRSTHVDRMKREQVQKLITKNSTWVPGIAAQQTPRLHIRRSL